MAWVAVSKVDECLESFEMIFPKKPTKNIGGHWECLQVEKIEGEDSVLSVRIEINRGIDLPDGTIYKLIGKELTWDDTPVEL